MMDADLLNGLCGPDCPVTRANAILGGKWTTLVLRDLMSGTKRYSQLQRSLSGISPKMLADRLALLEAEGLIRKTIYPVVPPKTEYTLTARGRKIAPVIAAMAEFGRTLQRADARMVASN
jgi:DNA-binding HxlR family transcriptional regulator